MSDKATGETDILKVPSYATETRVSFRIMRHGLGLNAEGQQWWELPTRYHTPQEVLQGIREHLDRMVNYPELGATEDEYVVLKETTTVELWSEADE